jgi:ligand-binding sensor domain-containing protein
MKNIALRSILVFSLTLMLFSCENFQNFECKDYKQTYTKINNLLPKSVSDSTHVLKSHENSMWVGTWLYGLIEYEEEAFSVLNHYEKRNENFDDFWVNDIAIDSNNTMWVAKHFKGASSLTSTSNEWTHYLMPEEKNSKLYPNNFRNVSVRPKSKYNEEEVWFSSGKNGLYIYDYNKWKNITIENSSLPTQVIWDLYFDPYSNSMLLGTNIGLYQYNNIEEKFYFNEKLNEGLTNTLHVLKILRDSQNRLWLGTSYGIFLYNNIETKLVSLIGSQRRANDDFEPWISDIKEDFMGNIWVSSFTDGVFKIELNGTVKEYSKNNGILPINEVTVIEIDGKGRIWQSFQVHGLYISKNPAHCL